MIIKCRSNSLLPDAFQLDYQIKYKPQPPLCILFIELLVHHNRANYVRLKVVKLQTFIFRFGPTFFSTSLRRQDPSLIPLLRGYDFKIM